MTTLITGASGWLGNRLVQRLLDSGRDVRCLIQPGVDPSLLSNFPVERVTGDVRDSKSLNEAMVGVETVFHCAGLIHPKRISDLFDTNTKGTENVLRAALNNSVEKIVYVSSNSAQGTNNRGLMDETQPCYPENAYGKSKLMAEQLVRKFHEEYQLPTVIIRPPMLYGPGQPIRMTSLMRMIKNGRAPVFGDGENLRSMAYVDNVVDGLLLAEEKQVAVGQTYWIADERPYATNAVLQTIADILEVQLHLFRLPTFFAGICELVDKTLSYAGMYSMDFHVVGESPKNIACSIDKARCELGYNPKISLQDGMQEAIDWCRNQGLL